MSNRANNNETYFNYYCTICSTYTNTSKKRHEQIQHYKGSFDDESESADIREPNDKRKLKSSSSNENQKPLFTLDKSGTSSNLSEFSESKSQAESPKKRQKRSPKREIAKSSEKPNQTKGKSKDNSDITSEDEQVPLYYSTSTIEPLAITKSSSTLSDPISDLKIDEQSDAPSKLRAEAPEFIPLAAKAKMQTQRRTFSNTFEQSLESEDKSMKLPITMIPPWLREMYLNYVDISKLSLHEEITQFVRWISPTPEEQRMRNDVISRISNVIYDLWPDSNVHIFGSFSTELFLPYSDLDLVVLDAPTKDYLGQLSTALQESGIIQNIQIISSAKVPIIKMMDAVSGCAVDISFNVGNGPENTRIIQEYIQELPLLRPIALVVKYFLQQRALNETFSGGIGSYALILMILSFLQHHSLNKNLKYWEEDLGVLLTDFFDFYGTKFNYRRTGISVRNGGSYFNKQDEGAPYYNEEKPFMLALEDPHDIENNVGRGSFQILTIRSAFAYAFRILIAESADFAPSKLSRILNIDETMVKYRQFIKDLYVNKVEKKIKEKKNNKKNSRSKVKDKNN